MRSLLNLGRAAIAAALLGSAGCQGYLNVENPTVIDQEALDPTQDAATLAGSAQQNFATSYGWIIMYSSWFVGETDVAETFPTRNEFGRRAVDFTNTSHRDEVWAPLSLAAASSYLVLDLTLPTPTTNLSYARAETYLGYSFVLMAETFCEGTVRSGASLSVTAMLDSAVSHFSKAITIGTANATATGRELANISLVGRARAQLQAGRKALAVTDANAVPAGFNFNLSFADDLANRTRLGNRMWQFTADRGSIAIAPSWRVTDPRIPQRVAPSNLLPQDANYTVDRGVPYVIQNKYPAFSSPIRLASKLEADYIAAEATGSAAMLALIGVRRAANQQAAYTGPTDDASVLKEFENQRGAEFFLEAKRMGDFRRNGAAVLFTPVPNSTYWKAGFAPVGSQTCWPLPQTEVDNNPNL